MHDPMTVAFEIRYPWNKYRGVEKMRDEFSRNYRASFITIWHNDPEIGGSDDSCGWFTPPLNKIQREIVHTLAADESREPWFMALDAKKNSDPVQCEALVRGAFLLVSRCLENRLDWRRWRLRKRPVKLDEATAWASVMVHNSVDNFRGSLAFKSGYHSNWYHEPKPNTVEEDKFFREREAEEFFGAIMGYILRERRPWYRKPRWHFWHWSFQVHPLQSFKRWAFSRCATCGKGFKWGMTGWTNSWNGTGPLWFRSESDIHHMDCKNPDAPPMAAQVTKEKTVSP